jgi:hypothetical protein
MKVATTDRAGPNRSAPQGWHALVRRLRLLRLLATYCLLAFLQSPFGSVFWALEQRKGQLDDKLTNEGIEA